MHLRTALQHGLPTDANKVPPLNHPLAPDIGKLVGFMGYDIAVSRSFAI